MRKMQPHPGTPRSTDRTPILLGGVGCGCGMLLAALVLVVLAAVTATASGALPTAKPDPSRPDITITVQDAFFQQMIARFAPGDVLRDVTTKMQPGGVVSIQGRIEASLLGQKLAAPFSLAMRLSVQQGRLRLDVTDMQMGTGQGTSAVAKTMLSGLGDQISRAINDQVTAGLGSGAYILDVTTDDRVLVIRARMGQ